MHPGSGTWNRNNQENKKSLLSVSVLVQAGPIIFENFQFTCTLLVLPHLVVCRVYFVTDSSFTVSFKFWSYEVHLSAGRVKGK